MEVLLQPRAAWRSSFQTGARWCRCCAVRTIPAVTGPTGSLLRSLPSESSDLDVVLDDAIVEAAWKRRVYPRRVLPHAVRSLKAERKLLVRLDRLG